jgi:hypothetical protein
MFTAGQLKGKNNVNRITEKAPFNLILRFKPKMRMNIEAAETKNNYNISKKIPAARQEIKLREKDTNLVRDM